MYPVNSLLRAWDGWSGAPFRRKRKILVKNKRRVRCVGVGETFISFNTIIDRLAARQTLLLRSSIFIYISVPFS